MWSGLTGSSLMLLLASLVEGQNQWQEPTSKKVIRAMDKLIANHVAWDDWPAWQKNMEPFWAPNMTYITVNGFPRNGTFKGLHEWFDGEHIPYNKAFWPCHFNQFIFAGDERIATTATFANAVWKETLGTEVHPQDIKGRPVTVRILDFYIMVPDDTAAAGARISVNWMMIDVLDLLLQAGQRVLPRPRLPEQVLRPPSGLDGIPAPTSFAVHPDDTVTSHNTITALLTHEWALQRGVAPQWAEDMIWYGPVGLGVAHGKAEYTKEFIGKMYAAFANVQLELDASVCEGHICGAHGHLVADHVGPWLGQAATHQRVRLRFGSHWRVVDGTILEGWTIFDLPHLFQQFGVDLFSRHLPMHEAEEALGAPITPPIEASAKQFPGVNRWSPMSYYNNTCLEYQELAPPSGASAPKTFLRDCPAWVIKSTDRTWHGPDWKQAVQEYFYEDWVSYSDAGEMRGLPALLNMVGTKRAMFPNLHIHIQDVTCHGNDVDGYKTIMPDVITGTDIYTGRNVTYRGIALCYVQRVQGRWQYVSEWVLHDTMSMMLQLGEPPQMAPPPVQKDCHENRPTFGWVPPGSRSTPHLIYA